jgi:hypothetical protein
VFQLRRATSGAAHIKADLGLDRQQRLTRPQMPIVGSKIDPGDHETNSSRRPPCSRTDGSHLAPPRASLPVLERGRHLGFELGEVLLWNMPTSARAVLSNFPFPFLVLTGSRMSLGTSGRSVGVHRMSCAVVRFYVAKYTTSGAELWARSHGATDIEVENAQHCLRDTLTHADHGAAQ